jgi:hypothetical protein
LGKVVEAAPKRTVSSLSIGQQAFSFFEVLPERLPVVAKAKIDTSARQPLDHTLLCSMPRNKPEYRLFAPLC